MKLQSLKKMLLEYRITELKPDDLERRNEMLLIYKYSVILEGEYMELDNLEKWITINIGKGAFKYLFYGKNDYDYCFAEYFFNDEQQALKVSKAIPHIYTLYPASLIPNHICRSDGNCIQINYNPEDKEAILLDVIG